MAKLRLVGAVGIKVRPDATEFRKEVDEQLRNLPNDTKIKVDVTANTDPAKKAIDKAVKEEEKRTLNIKVGVQYDTLQAARRQVEGALKNLGTEDIKVKLKEGDLNAALEKLKGLQDRAKVTMQINTDEAGYKAALAKIRAIQREKAEKEITFETDDKSLEKAAAKYEKLLAQFEKPVVIPPKVVTITHRNDHDSLTRAIAAIDEQLAKLKEVTLTPQLNADALLDARNALTAKLAKKPMVMKINDDKKGYEKVLARIQELQAKAAEIPIKFNTDPASLERAAKAAQKKIAELTPPFTVKYNYETGSIQKALDEVNKKLLDFKTFDYELKANLDEKGLLEAKKKLEKTLSKSDFKIEVDSSNLDQLKAEQKKIADMLAGMKDKDLTLTVKNNEQSLEETKRQLDELVKKREAEIKAKPVTWDAMLELAYASRARDVPFYVRINQRSLAIAEGVLQSLAGLNTLRASGRLLEDMITKFDTFSLKVAGLSTLLGSVTDAVIFMGTALFPIGEGVANLAGLLAFAPAALSSLTAVALINIAAFTDFKDAIDGNAKAMAKLPPQAQATAKALQGAWTKIQEPTQDKFWSGMGDSMQKAMTAMIPIFSKGLSDAAFHVGQFGAGVFRAMQKITHGGGPLEQMLKNLSGFFDNASGAAEPLVDAMNTLGLRGSEFLPRFGTWLTEISNQFNNWIKRADEAGKITVWMEQGIQSLKDLWQLGTGVTKMFQAITMAAKEAGSGGLGAVADEFDRIGTMMKGEPFQSRLSTIFDGAREGASHFNAGIKTLGTTLGEASLWVANLLSQLGKLGGDSLKTFSMTLRSLDFQSGILVGLQGMNTLVNQLETGFVDLGDVLGNMSRIAGAAFSSIGPVINNIISLLDVVVGTLADNLIATIPNLMGMVNGLITALSGPVTILANMLNGVLGFINSLPGPLAQVTLSLLAFLTMAHKIGPIFQMKPGGLLERVKYDFQQAETAGGKFHAGMKGIGAGAMAAVGGPWGIAIGLAITALGLFGDAQQRVARDVQVLTDAIKAQDDEGLASEIYKQWSEIDSSPMENFWRGAGTLWTNGKKAANEAANSIGIDSRRITEAIKAGDGETMAKDFDILSKAAARFPPSAAEIEGALGRLKLNMTGDEVKAHAGDFGVLGEKVRETGDKYGTAQFKADEFNKQIQNAPVDAAAQKLSNFNSAMQTYNDKTATADSRTRALKAALDILSGKQPSVEEAQLRVNDAMRAAAGDMQLVDGQMKLVNGVFRDAQGNLLSFNDVIDSTTGKINTQSTAGANLYRNLKDTTDATLAQATAMKDAGEPTSAIAAHLDAARQQYVDMGVAAGINKETVEAAWDHMVGANPKDLLTTITAQGVEEAETRVRNYKGTLDEINAYQAVAKIMGDDAILGEKLANSYTNLNAFDQVIATATADLNPEQADSVRQRILNDLINLAKTDPTVAAKMDPAILDREREAILQRLDHLARQKPTPEVRAMTEDAKAQLLTVQGLLAGITSKDIVVTTQYREIGNAPGKRAPSPIDGNYANGGIDSGFGVQMFSNGGVVASQIKKALSNVKFFANGGYENHTAQIARPSSTVRVWAEPETGGEAYIPLSASKRQRSTAILSEVASQFGYRLTNAQAFADGGVVTHDRTGGSVSVSIGNYNTNASETPDDVARALMRRVKSSGVYTPLEGF